MPSPPSSKKTSKTRKRRLGHKGHLHTRYKLKLPKVGGNKRNTKYESPPKLEIRIDRYTSESNDDSTDAVQKRLGFTKKDGPRSILRKVKEIGNVQKTQRRRGVSNNPYKRGNEHILKEERAMIQDERVRRGGNKRKSRTQQRRL